MEKDIAKLFKKDDPFLIYLMNELEQAEEILYNENLSAANYIYWRARKDALSELRDQYCK